MISSSAACPRKTLTQALSNIEKSGPLPSAKNLNLTIARHQVMLQAPLNQVRCYSSFPSSLDTEYVLGGDSQATQHRLMLCQGA